MIPPMSHLASLRFVPNPPRFDVCTMECIAHQDFGIMPTLFTTRFYNELPDRLMFIDIERNEFHATAFKDERCVYLGGWRDIATFYDLNPGGYVRMVYFGRGMFFIQVFNTLGDEVFAPQLNVPGLNNHYGPWNANPGAPLPRTTLSLRHTPMPTTHQHHVPVVGPSNYNRPHQVRLWNPNPNNEGSGENVVPPASSFIIPEDRPFYLIYGKELSWEYVTGQSVELPKQWCKAALPPHDAEVKLADNDGTKWPCFLEYEEEDGIYCHLGRGWSKFKTMKNLKLGDFVMFAVRGPNSNSLTYVHKGMAI